MEAAGMALTNAPGFLMFSGTNDRALIALCRGMTKYSVPFGLVGRGKGDMLKKSPYADHYLLDRTSETLHFEEICAAVDIARSKYGNEEWVICPTSEYLNIVLFPMRQQLAQKGITVATCEQTLYSRLSEKAAFRTYCEELGVPPPEILEGDGAEHLAPPYVAKPKTNLSRTGRILYPYLVRNSQERERFLTEAESEEYYLERFVEGESWYLLFYLSKDGKVTQGAQRNYLQQGMGKSILLARAKDYPDVQVRERFAKRLQADGYRGFIMVEVRRTGEGTAISIEANPRCWGPLQLTLDADMGLVEAFLSDHGHPVQPLTRSIQGRSYCWTGGMVQAMRSGKGLDRHGSRSEVIGRLLGAFSSDVYARRDSWSCLFADLHKR